MVKQVRLFALFLCLQNTAFSSDQDYSMAIYLISGGVLHIETYTKSTLLACVGKLDQEMRKEHTRLAINLKNRECTVEAIPADETHPAMIVLSTTTFAAKEFYTINLKILPDLDPFLKQCGTTTFTPWDHHDICNEEPSLLNTSPQNVSFRVTCDNNNLLATSFFTFDSEIQSICGIILPTAIAKNSIEPVQILNMQEAIERNVLIPWPHVRMIQQKIATEEGAPDEILNAMERDGTFAVKPLSPFMAYVQSLGSHLLIKYIALKEFFARWINQICNGKEQETTVTTDEETNKQN